jgi:predicted metal-binding protein
MRMWACEESARVHLVVVVVGVCRACRSSEDGKRTHRRPHSTLLLHLSPTSMHYRAHRVSINKPLYIPTGCRRDCTSKLRIMILTHGPTPILAPAIRTLAVLLYADRASSW